MFVMFVLCLLIVTPLRTISSNKPQIELIEVKNTPTVVINYKRDVYAPPTGEVLEIAKYVASSTGYPLDTISRIIWAESGYKISARHVNTNNSVDFGIFQINSQHIIKADDMGMDIFTLQGNADYAIYLIKTFGLSPWSFSKCNWAS